MIFREDKNSKGIFHIDLTIDEILNLFDISEIIETPFGILSIHLNRSDII